MTEVERMDDGRHPSELDRLPVTDEPLNAETPLEALASKITPASVFYIRNHFRIPEIEVSNWKLRLDGEVSRPVELTLDEIQSLPSKTLEVTLECAGNGRELLDPPVPGTPWGLGAVSTGAYTGTPLWEVVSRASPTRRARQLVFVGADRGHVAGGREVPYARGLPIAEAKDPDILLVWALNGEPLSPAHGYPLRLVVPAWYGMASVKWLGRIEATTEPFRGFFQNEHYVFWEDGESADGTPVTYKAIRSLITQPQSGARVPPASYQIRGLAWAGEGRVARVEVSVDGGVSWREAHLAPKGSRYAARSWSFPWHPDQPGRYTLMARATDSLGDSQPLKQRWNRLGYANNQVQAVDVEVEYRA